MPNIIVPCPQCSHQLHLPDRAYLGRKGRCPECQYKFVMDEALVVDEAEARELAEAQAAEAARLAEEQRAAEQRAAEEQAAKERAAEEQRKAEEEARKAEQQRLEEEKREQAEQQKAAEQKAAEQKAAEEQAAKEQAAKEKAAEEEAREQRRLEAEREQESVAAAQHAETQREGMPLTAGETIEPDPATVKTELNPVAAASGVDAIDGETVEYDESAAAAMEAMINGDDELPEQFGRYRVLEPIGHGSMGAVYLAHDSELDRKIALKIPRFSDPDSEEEIARFYREARAAATLRHPNICQVFDIGEIDGRHFIAMEFISGNPLSVFIAQPKFQPVRKIAATIRKVAKGLQEAHDKGLVHRDLKPDNIMIDERGEPTIMDFGLVRLMNDDDRITTSGAIVGSPAYMSPEQVSGTAEDVGPPSDVFSLGTITYELLTRRRPFRGSLSAIFEQISQSDPLAPSKLRSDIDRDFESICLRMMARDLSDRYASMKEVADALSDYLKDSSTSAISGNSAVPVVPRVSQPATKGGSDEDAARWILEIGGVLKVATADSKSITVPDVNSLPAAPFHVVDVALVKNESVTDEGLAHLSGLKHLLVLRLSETGITDNGLPCLSGLAGLPVLDLSYTKVTDAGLKHLKGLKGLKQLDLANTKITDAGLSYVRKLSELQFLGLYATGVTDAGIKTLSSLKNLQFLGLYGTKVTDVGVAKLKKSLKNCTISR